MPTYEYACTKCGNRIEVYQSFTDEPLTVCDVCGSELKRVYHPVGIVLKGSGFYATDSRGKKTASSPKPSSAETKKADTTSSSGVKDGGAKEGGAKKADPKK
ncbi:MAG TPA: FmdB family zinc ribbon protein [Actinomycetota bacterium]